MSEWKEIETFFEDKCTEPEEICRRRTECALKWYVRKAVWNKWIYYILTTISIICPLLNTIAAAVCTEKLIALIAASITTFATSVLAMTKAYKKWDHYRTAAEYLKSQYVLFIAGAEPYEINERRVTNYLKNIEGYMNQIHSKWEKGFHQETKSVE